MCGKWGEKQREKQRSSLGEGIVRDRLKGHLSSTVGSPFIVYSDTSMPSFDTPGFDTSKLTHYYYTSHHHYYT
jgi:hypothetical protein